MKQLLKYTLISLLAGLIFYGGAGVNWVTYCCNECSKVGIRAAVSESCCSTHTYKNKKDKRVEAEAKETGTYSLVRGLHNCGVERVSFEWTSLENERSLTILPFITDTLYHLSYTYLLTDSEQSAGVFIEEGDPPSALLPRTYLTLLTTLLI